MKLLARSQVRFIARAPWSTATLCAGVMLGIASVVAVHLISARVVDSLEAVRPTYLDGVAYLLERPGATMDDYFELRRAWRAGRHPAIAALMPIVEGRASLAGRNVTVLGVDGLSGVRGALPFGLLASGSVIADAQAGYRVGERAGGITIAAVSERVPEDWVVTDIGTAQLLLGRDDGMLSRIAVAVEDPWLALYGRLDALLPGFSAGFPAPRWSLPGWQARPVDAEVPGLEFGRAILFNLGALGSLALLVSWLLVYQVGLIWLRRRRRVIERLQQLGVTRRELLSGHLASLLILVVPSSVLALFVGAALARLLTAGVADGLGPPAVTLSGIDGWVVAKALASAVGAGLFGGWLAFRREWRNAEQRPAGGWLAVPIALMGVAGVLLTSALWGGFLAILAAALITLAAVHPALARLRGVSHRLRRLPLLARAGIRELVWHPGDLAIAIGALSLALATSLAIGLMVDSFRRDFTAMLGERLAHDLYVRGDAAALERLGGALATRAGVVRQNASGSAAVRANGIRAELGYADFDAFEAGRYGLPRPLARFECLVSERLARALSLEPGDDLSLDDHAPLRIAAVFPGYGDSMPRVLVGRAAARALGIEPRIERIGIVAAQPERLAAWIDTEHPGLAIESRAGLRTQALEIFDRTFAVTHALTVLALIVAAVALYNALLALKLTQRHTRSLFEALGVNAAEWRWLDASRCTGIGLAALAFALPLGLLMGWLLCAVVNPRAFGWSLNLAVTGPSLLPTLIAAAVAVAAVIVLPTPEESLDDPL